MQNLSELTLKMQVSGTDDIHVVPFVKFLKAAHAINEDENTIKIGDNNYRIDNAKMGEVGEEGMEEKIAPPVVQEEEKEVVAEVKTEPVVEEVKTEVVEEEVKTEEEKTE